MWRERVHDRVSLTSRRLLLLLLFFGGERECTIVFHQLWRGGGGGGRKCTIVSHQPGFKKKNVYVRSYCTNRGGGWRGGMSDRVLPNRQGGGGGGGEEMYDRV